MKAPVIIFVYNRADHVRGLVESLSKNPECAESDLIIFSDGPKNENAAQKVQEVRDYIRTLAGSPVFRSVEIRESEKNRGLAASIIAGVSEAMEKYGKAIIIEDDNVVAPDFLDYMNRGLDFYEGDPAVWCIGGFTRKMDFPESYRHDVFLMQRMSSYTWATWKDRWDRVEWDTEKFYPKFFFDLKDRRGFERCGADRAYMLDSQACGKKNSWAIRFEYSMYKNGMYAVLPCVSRAECRGNDGSGTHSSKPNLKYGTEMSDGSKKAVFEHLEMDEEVRKVFAGAFRRSPRRKVFRNLDFVLYYFTHRR